MNQELIFNMVDNINNNNIEELEKNHKEFCEKTNPDVILKKLSAITHATEAINNEKNINVTMDMGGIKGLWYIENYLSQDELAMIKEKITNGEIELDPISKSAISRKVAHYGYYYSYDKTGLKPAPVIPDYLENLVHAKRINDIVGTALIKIPFEQVIINEYQPGQQIAYHTDHTKLFGPIIACVTVGESVPIHFKHGETIKGINVEEGSMYIMTGDARYKWRHSLKNCSDNNRYSITYRTIVK